jgi:hypothetical protein
MNASQNEQDINYETEEKRMSQRKVSDEAFLGSLFFNVPTRQ